MIDLRSHKTMDIDAAADQVWELVADFGNLIKFWPPGGLEKIEVEGEGVGMVRHIHTIIGIVLSERLEMIDHEKRHLELTITGDLPADMQNYRAHGEVHETGPDSCRIEWTGTYQIPDPDAEAGARAFIEGAYTAMFTGIRDYLTPSEA
jgi:carbon monoxide dehydrogenase subunit G